MWTMILSVKVPMWSTAGPGDKRYRMEEDQTGTDDVANDIAKLLEEMFSKVMESDAYKQYAAEKAASNEKDSDEMIYLIGRGHRIKHYDDKVFKKEWKEVWKEEILDPMMGIKAVIYYKERKAEVTHLETGETEVIRWKRKPPPEILELCPQLRHSSRVYYRFYHST